VLGVVVDEQGARVSRKGKAGGAGGKVGVGSQEANNNNVHFPQERDTKGPLGHNPGGTAGENVRKGGKKPNKRRIITGIQQKDGGEVEKKQAGNTT